MDGTAASEGKCVTCSKDQSQLSHALKKCAKCKTVQYCSRECQKQDWKTHKKICTSASSTKPRFAIDKPFHALENGTWLRNRPEPDVHQLVCDVFRMRREDKYLFEQSVEEGSIYAGASADSEIKNFRHFLQHITAIDASKPASKRLLPSWWSEAALERCIEVARTDKDAMVGYAVEKSDIEKFYEQDDMPMQLRMFGEALDGTMVMGQSREAVLKVKVAAEAGKGVISTISL